MNKNANCVFCEADENLKIYETKNLFILFDPYPLMEGHLMISSKEHYGCAGELPEEFIEELSFLKEKVRLILKKTYGNVSFYEHGRAGGCMATDPGNRLCHHFHLHALPFTGDVHRDLETKFRGKPLEGFSMIKTYFEGYGEYLYFENCEGVSKFYPSSGKVVPSHHLRTLISQCLGHPHRADWETYSQHKERVLVFNTNRIKKHSDLFLAA
ncbi:MAG: hypothetical protein K2Y08_06515 [Alphaproteobacteria bacterium]|nr:hypothetical protein [Alphaproteobacteria bacterium]